MVQRFLGSIVGLRHFLGVSDLADRDSRETSSKIAGESWISHQRQFSSYLVVGNQSSRHLQSALSDLITVLQNRNWIEIFSNVQDMTLAISREERGPKS